MIPESVVSIKDHAFFYCSVLTNVTIGSNVTSIGAWAFADCPSLPGVVIGNRVNDVGANAFDHCTGLTSVLIGTNVTSIGGAAFTYCTSLGAFTVDPFNPAYSSGDGVLFDKGQTTLVQYPDGKAGSYIVPRSVTNIASSAFAGCLWLYGVTISNSVTMIGQQAFSDCRNLAAITVAASNPAYYSAGGVLFNKSQTTLIQYPGGKAGSYTVPNSVTNIAPFAFYACFRLTGLTLGNSVTTIEPYAFEYCVGLTSIMIPDSVTGIGYYAFYGCNGLSSATIGNGVTSIGYYAFAWTHLATVTVGAGVTDIGAAAFYDCVNLKGVYFKGNAPAAGSSAFAGDNNATVYYLPRTTGWGATYGGRPTTLWFLPNPLILAGPSFGVKTNQFGFIISWATNVPVIVEACTDPGNPLWSPVATITLTSGSAYFSDPQWTNYPGRFYRLRSP
jgi:hypothetical protein